MPVEFSISIDTTYIATDILYAWLVLNLPTSQFAYSQFAYSHFAYICVSFQLHMGSYDLERLSRDKTDFDLLWSITLDGLVKTKGVQGTRLTRGGPALSQQIQSERYYQPNRKCGQQKMVYYWEKMLCTHPLLAKCKLRWIEGCKWFGHVHWKIWLYGQWHKNVQM